MAIALLHVKGSVERWGASRRSRRAGASAATFAARAR
jgi:hypothetical protein